MGLRVRKIQLRAATELGYVGADIPFTDGLNVLAAPNSAGKSTCLTAILYGLGLEGMLGPSHSPPFPDAMQESVMLDQEEWSVVESYVRVEIENGDGERLTTRRMVTGTRQDRQLVRCVFGEDLTRPSTEFDRRDFYVRMPGAAQNEAGFHRILADFLRLDLPRVPGVESETVPLYLECLFPYFFVDQLAGWRDIKSRMPTYLRIPEMAKRSAEYILGLDILTRAMRRQYLEHRREEVREKWTSEIGRITGDLSKRGVIVRGLPESPQAEWPPDPLPQTFVTDGDQWVILNRALENVRHRQETLREEEIPRAEEIAQQVITELRTSEEQMDNLTERLDSITQEIMRERSYIESIDTRLRALEEDYANYRDLKRVLDRGGAANLATSSEVCPACGQPIKDALLPQETTNPPMTLEENITYINDQIHAFADMRRDALAVLEAKEAQRLAITRRISEVNRQIQSQKRTLHSDGRVPSVAAVREHLQLEESAGRLQEAYDEFEEFLQSMQDVANEWVEVNGELQSLRGAEMSENDGRKIGHWESAFIEQLREYEFESFRIEHMSLSRNSYRPAKDGYDVGLTSASDTIRMIWAYLLGLLDVDRSFQTNHIGLLVFDEPRQQGTEKVSFDALLTRAANVGGTDHQVIFATSEEKDVLNDMLASIQCNYIPFQGRILQRVS